jgi:Family of unknown function (DUF5681)
MRYPARNQLGRVFANQQRKHEHMNIPPNYEVGFGRPPERTRWKTGECGNPKKIRKRFAKPAVQMIDDFFAAEVDIVERGISRRVSNFEAIVLQLLIQAIAGKKRAINVLLQYQEFAAQRGGGMGGTLFAAVPEDASPRKPGGNDGGAGK